MNKKNKVKSNKRRKKLALIGLRSGSKGIKNKNIKLLGGKPLFTWIINTAYRADIYDDIIISSDSDEYLKKIKKYYPNIILHKRKVEFAKDDSLEFDFVNESIRKYCKENSIEMKDIIYSRLHVTSPLQNKFDLINSVQELLASKEATSAIVVRECEEHPMKAMKIIEENNCKKLISIIDNTSESTSGQNRQQLGKFYKRANVITAYGETLYSGTLTGNFSIPVKQSGKYYIDIDNEFDFWIANKLIEEFSIIEAE